MSHSDIHGFTEDSVNRIARSVRATEKMVIGYPTRRRRYPIPVQQDIRPQDGGTSMCGCCDGMDCVPPDSAIVTACSSCPTGATDEYTFTIGTPETYPEVGGDQSVVHDPGYSSCTWTGDSFTVATAAWVAARYYYAGDYVLNDSGKQYTCTSAGSAALTGGPAGTGTGITDGTATWDYAAAADTTNNYRWRLTQAGTSSTLRLDFVSGTDVINLTDRPITYTATAPWSCRCISKMVLSTAETFANLDGVAGVVCLEPVASTGCCDTCFGFTLSGIAGPPSECSSMNGDWLLPSVSDCEWDQVRGDVSAHISFETPNATLTLSGASFPVTYGLEDPHFCDGNAKVLTQIGGATCTGFPATITLTPMECETTTTTTSTSTSSTSSTTETSTTTASSSTTETSTSTSTSSTTSSGCISNGCEWTWSAGSETWSVTNNNCEVPCAACVTPPGYAGMSDFELAYKDCEVSI